MTESRFVPGVKLEADDEAEAYVLAYRGRKLLVHEEERAVRLPRLEELQRLAADDDIYDPLRRLYLGTFDGRQVFAAELAPSLETPPEKDDGLLRDAGATPEGMAFHGLARTLHAA